MVMFDELSDLYQQVILDHSRAPRNFRVMPDADCQAQGHNPLCGDNLTLYFRMNGDTVVDASFQGSGCAISRASASLLTELVKGRSRAEVRDLFTRVRELVTRGTPGGAELGKLAVFAGVHKYPARVKCAILAWHAALAALAGDAASVTTE